MRVSNSKIKTWNRCHKQYEFKYVMGLRPKKRKFPLELGSWVHDLLMTRADGENWKRRHKVLKARFDNLFEEEKEDLGDLPAEAYRLMRSYLRTYEKEDRDHRVIDTEMDEIITLPSGHEFNFIIDEIYEDSEGLWLRDHKTVSKFMPKDFMLLDAQLTRYFYCAEKMGYTPLMGVEFNEIRTKAPSIPHRNKDGFLSQAQKIDTDYWTYLAEIKKLGQDPKIYMNTLRRLWGQEERFFRRSRLPKDKPVTETMMLELDQCIVEIEDAKAYPRSPDKSCEWMCDYKDLCIVQLQGGNIDSVIKHKYDRRKRSRKDDR